VRRAALLAAVVLAGCGSSGPHLPRAVYVKRATGICTTYRHEISRLGQPTKISDIGPFIAHALPVLQRTVDRLGRLAPPADLESQFGKFMDAARATVGRAQALRDAASRADAQQVQRLLRQAAAASGQRVRLAQAAGLPACALQ